MGMERFIIAALILVSSLWFCSCESEELDKTKHYTPKDYSGWITAVTFSESVESPNMYRNIYYDNQGIAIVEGGFSLNWRVDEFYVSNIEDECEVFTDIVGEIDRSGSRMYSDYGRTVYFISGWIGEQPLDGRDEHIKIAVSKALSLLEENQ